MTVARLFDVWPRAAAAHGGRTWIRCGATSLSYAQALDRIERLGHGLATLGVDGRRAPIALDVSDPALLALLIGAAAAQDVPVALMPGGVDAPALQHDLDGIGAGFLVTDNRAMLRLPQSLHVEQLSTHAGALRIDPSPTASGAFLLPTSGTEGEPRWVVCGFDQCLAAIRGMESSGAMQPKYDRTVYLSPSLTHSYGLSSLLEYTWCGSTIVLPTGRSVLGTVGELVGDSPNGDVTAIEAVPFFYEQCVRLAARIVRPKPSHIGVGAGALSDAVLTSLRRLWTGAGYSVRYGLTETPSAVAHTVYGGSDSPEPGCAGCATGAYELAIVGDDGESRPAGEVGEIVVRSGCIGRYIGGDSVTTLATGDLGRLDDRARLHVTGRRSVFLKRRGFRISPEQIESVVAALPGIIDCRARMVGEQLVVEVVAAQPGIDTLRLLGSLAGRLPAYCLPDRIDEVETIPRNRAGKIRRY